MSYNSNSRPNRRRPSGGGNRSNYRRGGNRGGYRSSRSSKVIDPRRFVKAAKPVEQIVYEPEHSFEDFAVDFIIKRNLEQRKFITPTQIQDKAIPVGLQGKDVVGIANTGTGKTAAFLLPLLQNLMNDRSKKALIIAPTRELALQIQQESRATARGAKLFDVLIIGGASMGRQLSDLRRNPQIIIGTPGRIKDHVTRGTLRLDSVNTVVLDEVDRMLDMGFINDIRMILGKVPEKRQSLFFSATMSPTIERLIQTFTNDPVTIMARTSETSDNVEQSVMHFTDTGSKINKLHELLLIEHCEKALIFCETKRSTDRLHRELEGLGFASDSIHGNKSQGQRQRALKKFKEGHVDILVATDVAARGIDVDGITHVVNYDTPQTYDDYTHRIGRTGRGSNTGHAVTFVQQRSR